MDQMRQKLGASWLGTVKSELKQRFHGKAE
jgi:hypothetical protein